MLQKYKCTMNVLIWPDMCHDDFDKPNILQSLFPFMCLLSNMFVMDLHRYLVNH